MEAEKEVSITIRGIPESVKNRFAEFCTLNRISMQDMLKNFIIGAYVPDSALKDFSKIQLVNEFLYNRPDVIDKFILEREPMYNNVLDFQKGALRHNFVAMNPTYIFDSITKWIENSSNTQ